MLRPWTPDLVSLDLLLSVAELGSVSRAAAAHGLSQPSASTRLARLERQLGVQVLDRTSRGSSLTPAGEAVLAWATAVVNAARELTDGVESLRGHAEARVRVAASLTVAEYLLPGWLLALRRRHPDVEVVAAVENSRAVAAQVAAGQADVGFVESPLVPDGLERTVVGHDRLVLVVGHDGPVAAGAEVSGADLVGLPLLLRETGSGTRETFLQALTQLLGEPPALPHADALGSTATILATARAGGGIGVVSARAAAGDLATGALGEVRVPGLLTERPLTAVWPTSGCTPLARELVEVAAAAGTSSV
ncbi:LysR family transcriptional regulator [Nocardioides sp. GY 10127]|uniref:LysR family transcriptional regulator n=1 Tax=Nocardioides sp. GY 10127 TaxID=2569762 RepID=UPI0010A77252|nr:LysR family transcriptional regulator [Nocardioides sp. GY 10127]TIC82688.1 LysR family transcriptional regulator [Nocardioides sp. GY 10127]